MAEPRPSRTAAAVLKLERQAGRPWFLPMVGLFPLADFLLPFLPNQLLLAALAMLQPARWRQLALLFAAAAGLATFGVAIAIQAFGQPLVDAALGGLPPSSAVAGIRAGVERHGLAAVAALSLLPWTPRTAVIVCALAGLPPAGLAASVGIGRLVPTTLLALTGARAPALLRRNPRVNALMLAVEQKRGG